MLSKESKLSILKGIGIGAGALAGATGIGAMGYGAGKKKGVSQTATAMSSAFKELNAKENAAIRSSFNRYNEKENKAIAAHYFRKGVALGANYGAQQKTASTKESVINSIYNDTLENEFNKLINE